MNKNRLIEILIIIGFSMCIAFIYNYTLPKPLPLIYQKKEIPKLSDSVLFGNNEANVNLTNGNEKTVTYEQMLKISENLENDFIIVDARNSEEWKKNKIGNAINIFPYDEESVIINKILDLPTDKKIIVYCDGGNCDSSHKITEMMKNFGYQNVYIFTGGWEEWKHKKGIKD